MRQRRTQAFARQRNEERALPVPELTSIEQDVVVRVARGLSKRAVADELRLSVRTVEWHLARARGKLARAAALHDRVRQAAEPAGAEGGET
jgi:DNA-binding NarL/FixJ family response regulator